MTDTQQWVAMGYIKGVFGVKGWLKIAANTEYADSLLDYPEWQLRKDSHTLLVKVESGKLNTSELLVKLEGIEGRDAAFALRGYTIDIMRSQFGPAEENEYYWADLIGMDVVNREGLVLGKIQNLMQTGAHDILVIDSEHEQRLIPFVSHFIDEVNSEKHIVTVDWGLDY